MEREISSGARIIVDRWLELEPGEQLLIVTSEEHKHEMEWIQMYAKKRHAHVSMWTFPTKKGQIGHYFDEHVDAFDAYDVILGATTHSLVTTKAVKRAVERGGRFLSLPLATNDGRSILTYDFLNMDPSVSKNMGDPILTVLNKSKMIRVETEAGTRLTFRKVNRNAQCFTGSTRLSKGYASSSFEIFVPIEETETSGVAYVDASLGYLGIPEEPVRIALEHGRIVAIQKNSAGVRLKEYMDSFGDEGMYVAGEFGIGLNAYAKCNGACYIEDESAYGTFHIGFGRNIAFGGMHEAKGHFDLVFHKPDIYADDQQIMKRGELVPMQERKEDIKE